MGVLEEYDGKAGLMSEEAGLEPIGNNVQALYSNTYPILSCFFIHQSYGRPTRDPVTANYFSTSLITAGLGSESTGVTVEV
jgi:hypothetical protein